MFSRGVISWARLSRSLRSAQKMGGKVYVSPAISDPFIMGIIRPKIYLPVGLSCSESELIIKHENAHLHRGDHIAKIVMYAALCIHCFNPLVWVMFRLFERDMEMSCDEKVTAGMTKEQKVDYSQTLLKISAKPAAAFTACFGENSTKQRIKNVLSFNKPAVWVMIVLAVAAVVVSVVLCINRSDRSSPSSDEILPNDGNYYSLSDSLNAYFVIRNGKMQLFGTDNDILRLIDQTGENIPAEDREKSIIAEKNKWRSPVNYSAYSTNGVKCIDEESFEYHDIKFYSITGRKVNISNTDEFSAEAYIIPMIDRHKIFISITNNTDDELDTDFSYNFNIHYTSYTPVSEFISQNEKYTFKPHEVKNYLFSIIKNEAGIVNDAREINGYCSLVITNSNKNKHTLYNKLELEPVMITDKNEGSYALARGRKGVGYLSKDDLLHGDEKYERRSELITDEEELTMYREQLYPEYGGEIYSLNIYIEGIPLPLYDDKLENIIDYFWAAHNITVEPIGETNKAQESTPIESESETQSYVSPNPAEGLVYFTQPSITLYPKYKTLDEWECRDREVIYDYPYEDEWDYDKELIFAFSNFTDEPVTVDSIQIVRDKNDIPVRFTNGENSLDIDFTVQPKHKTHYLLKAEDFDYSACESGIYRAIVSCGGKQSEFRFLINNTELHTEKFTSETPWGGEYDVYAPAFLTEEQQHIFAQAQGTMWDWFWSDHYLPPEYTESHSTDDFMQMLYDVFTKEYADELSKKYIDENGEFIFCDGARGTNISYIDHCFMPITEDEEMVVFKAVATYAYSDFPYEVSFEDEFFFIMKNTENGWRVDRFDIWS